MQITLKSVLTASALILSVGTAVAANEAINDTADMHATTVAQAQATDIFSKMDANKDGAIDQKEASASDAVSKSFPQADTNQDGKLSREEFDAAYQKGS